MAIDRRRRRLQRLTLLAAAFVVLAAGVAGLYLFQQHRNESRQLLLRQEGLAAYAAGDMPVAAAKLGDYVDARPDADAETLLAAAEASYRAPLPGAAHVRRAQQWLVRLRAIDPKNQAGNDLLLEIAETHLGPEQGERVATDVLDGDPQNGRARLLRASRRLALNNPADALADAEKQLELEPGDAEASLLRVQARLALGEDAELVAADADAALAAAEAAGDASRAQRPGLRLAAAFAELRAGRTDRARELLEEAAGEPPADGRFAVRLTRLLDATNNFAAANAYVAAHAASFPPVDGPGVELTRRLFEAGRLEDVAARLGGLDGNAPTELLAIRAMSLAELGRRDQAEATLDLLADHADPIGVRWERPLRLFYAQPRLAPRVLEAAAESVDNGLAHPYLLAIMGRCHAEVDDFAAALTQHRAAAEARNAWAAPRVLAARALLELDRPAEAEAEATGAYLRRTDLLEPLVLKAEAMARLPGREQQTLDLTAKLLEQVPDEPRLVVLEAATLAQRGDDQAARAAIERAVRRDPPLPPASLLELARVGQAAGLDTDTLVLDRLNEAYGDRPELIYARAARLAAEGQPDAGLALIRPRVVADDPSWRLLEATYLQLIDDPGAREAWAATSEAFPSVLEVQRRVLASPLVLADRELSDRVIERVRSLAGSENLQWRMARARWLLDGPGAEAGAGAGGSPADDAAAAEAEKLLDEVLSRARDDAEALLLRARAHERQGRTLEAARDAEAALQQASDSPSLRLEVARLQQAVGNFPAALANLVAVADGPADRLDAAQTRSAALLLAAQGDYARAIGLLERLQNRPEGAMGAREQLLLGQLYAQVGQEDAASRTMEALLAAEPDAASLQWAAGFYAESGDPERAQAVLDRLEGAGVEPGRRRAILADHAARYGSLREALAEFEAAVAAGDPGAASRLAGFNLGQGRGEAALDAARAGLAGGAAGEEPGLADLVARADAVGALAGDPAFRPILQRLLRESDPGLRASISAALTLAADTAAPPVEKLSRLRQMARDADGIVELQTLAAQLHLRAGRNEEALALAEAAAIAHPNAVPPAQARALAFFALERWDDALASAMDWRRRSARDPLAADLLIARSRLAKGQPAEAEAALAPYLRFAEELPGQMADFAAVYGRALAESGRAREATDFLGGHLDLPQWRAAALAITPSLRDADARSAWLETLTAAVPESEPSERFRVANAWWALHLAGGVTARDAPDAGRVALRLVTALAERPDATMPVHAAAGMMAESLGEPQTAVAAYRRALDLNPDAQAVRNNLAMVLIGDDGPAIDAAAGLQLAREAVAAEPENADFRDTLALAQVANGNVQEALRTIEVAIDLEPSKSAWRDRQAEILRMQ
ncbi:tetratricopeptide repeat protein [Phycisphaera mikurensis]|uniref:Tetratricopeptide repeat protein n=1 Tax=Phycisphaera mikurensis (strain NBRC 102666 / KCTC 22515 / FYK2301M01) TaxID=1142394 RepID=I0IDB0_PHYMF|nr:hypothetical protein [Phycisphaera mikurensis]MBB6442373.1 putative Zn-dependent protease [Phycisphaera mikurensis]BAM03248.1 hypothetical protein PSMK_10890 [Phycisphaera mikurensis NBRC 102666]